MKIWKKKTPSKLAYTSEKLKTFPLTALTAQTVKLIVSNVAYEPTINKTWPKENSVDNLLWLLLHLIPFQSGHRELGY